MSYIKKVKYKNELGQELVFDNHLLFCEQIDTTGTQGVFNTESLAFSDGQMTTSAFLGAKTIPCSFALKVLTVYSEWDKYEIDVRPAAVPSFQREKDVPYVWRWDVDFIADFPYWRVCPKRSVTLKAYDTVIRSDCPLKVPVEIYFPPNKTTPFKIRDKGFTYYGTNCDVGVVLKSQRFECIGTDGNDYSQNVDVTADIENLHLQYGENRISCQDWSDIIVSYYYLSTGVF